MSPAAEPTPPHLPTAGPTPVGPSRPPTPRRSKLATVALVLFLLLVVLSVVAVGGVVLGLIVMVAGGSGNTLHEHHFAGNSDATDKIAIIRIEGVLLEGMTGYAERQIEQAAEDKHVKAVVVRINSPGGSITASDHLHRLLTRLGKGELDRQSSAKPIVVSMGSMAASGGYYIAMPAKRILAERTTMTGSIGVFAAMPNVSELGEKIGLKMNVIKAGDAKDTGSLFKKSDDPKDPGGMSRRDQELWQNIVDHAYLQFIAVVEEGRPKLEGKLQDDVVLDSKPLKVRHGADRERTYNLTRYRADGGIFTAQQAQGLGLIDDIGYLEQAIEEAATMASLGTKYQAITYDRPQTLLGTFLGVQGPPGAMRIDADRLADGATPRLWYLAPECELAGLLKTVGR